MTRSKSVTISQKCNYDEHFFRYCCWSITSGNFLVSHPKCLLFEMGLSISSVGLLRDFLGRRDQQYESSRAAPCVTWLRAELETTNAMPGS